MNKGSVIVREPKRVPIGEGRWFAILNTIGWHVIATSRSLDDMKTLIRTKYTACKTVEITFDEFDADGCSE